MTHANLGKLAIWSMLLATTVSCSAQTDGPEAESASSEASGTLSSKDWPEFRGPGRMGVSSASGLPVSWDESKSVAWKIALPGPGSSSPIVYEDRIYLTCYTGYGVPGESGGTLAIRMITPPIASAAKVKFVPSMFPTPSVPPMAKLCCG